MHIQSAYCQLAFVKVVPNQIVLVQLRKQVPSRRNLAELRLILGELIGEGKKASIAIDTGFMLPLLREDRLLTDACLFDMATKVAFVYSNNMGKMIGRLFIQLSTSQVPMHIFDNKNEAYLWLSGAEDFNEKMPTIFAKKIRVPVKGLTI